VNANVLLSRVCSHCKEEKPIVEFYFRKAENRYGSWCKSCESTRASKSTPYTKLAKVCTRCGIEKSVTDFWAQRTRGNRPNPECKSCSLIRSRARPYTKRTPTQTRKYNLKNKYGISLQEYQDMFDKQEGLCGICQQPPKTGQLLFVDHSHTSGKVRNLLCSRCNTILGHIECNPTILPGIVNYLKEYK
jgi:hypothetical protein